MPPVWQSDIQNRLLRALAPQDFDLVQPHLHPMATQLHQPLIVPHAPIKQLFFPESGFASITSGSAGRRVEVGMIGPEGVVGALPVLIGDTRSPYEHFIQSPGEVLTIGADELIAATGQSASLHRLLLRFVQTLFVQTAQTAFVTATSDIEARVARWLLMSQDRLGGNEVAITHGFLAMMLGVQRPSITLALQTLEGGGSIRARRGRVEVHDREQLRKAAGAGYGLAEAEYARLMGGA